MQSFPVGRVDVESVGELSLFRTELRSCLTRRGDGLFELADAMLCTSGPVRSPVELSLEPEFTRRHSSVYDALHHGRLDAARLRQAQVARIPAAREGEPLMFAVDTTPTPRPDARFADQRTMVMVRGKGADTFLPGWNFSVLVGVEWGASSWVSPIEARRLRPTEHHTEVVRGQIRTLLADLETTGRLVSGDIPPLGPAPDGWPGRRRRTSTGYRWFLYDGGASDTSDPLPDTRQPEDHPTPPPTT